MILLWWACGSPCAPDDSPTVTIGTGETAFEAHTDGDPVPLVRGNQGGVHIPLALQATGFDISEAVLGDFDGYIGELLVGQTDPFVPLECDKAADTLVAWDLRLIYDDEPENLDGQTTQVEVTLLDSTGGTASASTTFVIDDPSL